MACSGTTEGALVSIVTVCFNSETHLAEAMRSVLDQTYREIEYIVVDGGSTDGTLDVIRSFEESFGPRMRWLSEPDDGVYDAMNKGLALCTGELVGMLNSDDRYLVDAVERVADSYRAHRDSNAFFGDAEILDESGAVVRLERADGFPDATRRPKRMPMCHQSLFVARTLYERLGGYDTRYRVLADYEFVLRAQAAGASFTRVEGPIAQFRTGGLCSADMAVSNREREQIRVRYGANPAVERIRRIRHGFNQVIHDALLGKRS